MTSEKRTFETSLGVKTNNSTKKRRQGAVTALHDVVEIIHNSDDIYAEELQLQEALVSSSWSPNEKSLTSLSLPTKKPRMGSSKATLHDVDEIILISDDESAEELQLQEALLASSSWSPNKNASTVSSSSSTSSQASKSHSSFCAICMDTNSASEMFQNGNTCGHLYCKDCIRGHVAAKIQENITKVKCPDPGCKAVIGPQVCRSIVPKEVFERWENILCESLITEAQKFYCPFRDCSAMLVDDGDAAVTSAECPICNRLFCAKCKVAWHCGISCVEFQCLKNGIKSPDDNLLDKLAKKSKWMKCPNCKLFVEKVEGCNYIACRCRHEFCYKCGKSLKGHSGCAHV